MWGMLHGILSILDRLFRKQEENLIDTVRWIGTFFAVNLLWLLFRADSIAQWKDILIRMFTFQDLSVSRELINRFVLPETGFMFKVLHLETLNSIVRGLSLFLFTVISFGICLIPENNYKKLKENNWMTMILASVAIVWSILCLSSESVFVYYNF